MAGKRGRLGKIGFGALATESGREAFQADLQVRGVDLRRLRLDQVGAAAKALLADPTTLTAQAHGADGWSRVEHLLALVVDELRTANWMRTKDGQHNRNRPKPVSPLAKRSGKRIGQTDRSPAEVIGLLERYAPGRHKVPA